MKKLLAILCALSILVSGLSISAFAAVTTTPTKTIATNVPKAFPSVKQDPSFTLVNFWHAMSGFRAVLVDNIVNWYNSTEGKKNKIYVKSIFQGDYDAITIKIQATLQSGKVKDLPDIVQLSAQGAFSVKESANIIYLEDLMAADPSFKMKDKLSKNAMWACSYKGKQLGMPFAASMPVLHYNADAFKLVGLDPNNPPKTIAEYASAATKLVIKGSGSKPVRYGASNKIGAYHLATWISRQKNGTSFQFDMEDGRQGVPTKLVCATDGTLKATITEWKKVLDTNVVDFRNSAPRANFEQGFTAMYMDSMVQFELIQSYHAGLKDKSKAFENKMYRIPTVNPDDAIGEATGGNAVYMFNKGDDTRKKASWQFVKFLSTVDVSAYWYVNCGYYPLNNDALNTKYVQDFLKKVPNKKMGLQIRDDSVNNYKFQETWIPSYTVYSNMVGDQVALLAQGKLKIDETVSNISKKANYLLQTYQKANS